MVVLGEIDLREMNSTFNSDYFYYLKTCVKGL